MDDDWHEDGSFRALNAGNGQVKTRGKSKGPQYTRVIPQFLQQYYQPPAIQAKFAMVPKDDEEEENEGLDEVQQAAIDEYLVRSNNETIADTSEKEDSKDKEKKKKQDKVSGQNVVEIGKPKAVDTTSKKKRKRIDRVMLSNKKLLSFTMDDE